MKKDKVKGKGFKKGLCSLSFAILGGAALSMPFLTGCGEKNEVQTGYDFVAVEGNLNQDFYQNDTFSIEGRKMTLKDRKTNENVVIVLSDNMIVNAPDMTTDGQKEVTVCYDGENYSFNINVLRKTPENTQRQLQALLSAFKNGSIKNISLSGNYNYDFRFLNQTNSKSGTVVDQSLAKSDLANFDFDEQILKDVYDTFTNALVKTTLRSGRIDVADPLDEAIKLNGLNILMTAFSDSLSTPKLSTYVVNAISFLSAANDIYEQSQQGFSKEFVVNTMLSCVALTGQTFSFDEITNYLNLLADHDYDEIVHFVAHKSNNETLHQNLHEFGTPYYLFETLKPKLENWQQQYSEFEDKTFSDNDVEIIVNATLNLAKSVDEFILSNDSVETYVLNSVKAFAQELYDADIQDLVLNTAIEVLNTTLNKDYESASEFVALLLDEPYCGVILQHLLPLAIGYYVGDFVDAQEITDAFTDIFGKISENKSFVGIELFENLTNILLSAQALSDLPQELSNGLSDATLNFARQLDQMMDEGDFSNYNQVCLEFVDAIKQIVADITAELGGTEEDAAWSETVCTLQEIVLKTTNLLVNGEVENPEELLFALLDDELVGKELKDLLTFAVYSALAGDIEFDENLYNIVETEINKIATNKNFDDFSLFASFYDYVKDELDMTEPTKAKFEQFLNDCDAVVAGMKEPNVVLRSGLDFLAEMFDELTNEDNEEIPTIVFKALKALSAFGVEINDFVVNIDKASFQELLETAVAETVKVFVEDEDTANALIEAINQRFVEQFVNEFEYVDGIVDASSFNLVNVGQYFIDTIEEIRQEQLDANLKSLLLKLLDVNNENYAENLFNAENAIAFLEVLTKTSNEDALCNFISQWLYENASNGQTQEEEFIEQANTFLNEILEEIKSETPNFVSVMEKITAFSEDYLSKEISTTLYSILAIYLISTDDGSIDYNEVFSFIELPNGVSVDYNRMVQKLKEQANFDDLLQIANIETNIVSSQNNLQKEIVRITFRLSRDIEIASASAEFVVVLELEK